MRAVVFFNLYESAKTIRLLLTEHFKLYNPTRMSFAHRWHHDKTKTDMHIVQKENKKEENKKTNLFDCYD